jgi:hypothetical protein
MKAENQSVQNILYFHDASEAKSDLILKLSCDSRFQRAFNATACNKRTLKMRVATHLEKAKIILQTALLQI